MKVSVITPSVRPELIEIVAKCLKRQSFQAKEWLIGGPESLEGNFARTLLEYDYKYVIEPPKKEGDYYGLNKAWNALFREAKGDLIVDIMDGLWFPSDILEKLWSHYEANPKACITCVGDQYKDVVNGKPENKVWVDPRKRTDSGSFYEVGWLEMEFCMTSFPRQMVLDVGGIDEEFDKGAAVGEKELMMRATYAEYKTYISQDIEYRAIHHPRLSGDWDEKYLIAQEYYNKCAREIIAGARLKLNYL